MLKIAVYSEEKVMSPLLQGTWVYGREMRDVCAL